jgi:hypothetical protein
MKGACGQLIELDRFASIRCNSLDNVERPRYVGDPALWHIRREAGRSGSKRPAVAQPSLR